MLRLVPTTREDDLRASTDLVVLADGRVVEVQRCNLAAAKELLAQENAALRRVATGTREQTAMRRYG